MTTRKVGKQNVHETSTLMKHSLLQHWMSLQYDFLEIKEGVVQSFTQ